MRILFIHQYFRTPEEGGGIRSYYMCKALVEEGHQVEVITAHNLKQSVHKTIAGISVHYLPVYYENRLGFIGRSFAFFKFLVLTTLKALRLPGIDIAYASSSPLTVGIITLILKKIKGIDFIFEVMDLWPEAPIQMGFIRNSLLKKSLRLLEKIIYKNSRIVVAASPGMQEGINKVSPHTRVIMIPNMSDCDLFNPSPKNQTLVEKYKVENKLVCCYTGAIGISNDLIKLVEAATYLKQRGVNHVQFLVAGDGGELPRIKQLSEQNQLDNITFIGFVSKKEIAEIYNVADLNLIFFNEQRILETNSPNKFFDGIAAGLPTIINISGWIKDMCEKHQCGKYFNRDKPEELELILNDFYSNRALLNSYSNNSRKLAENRFKKEIVLKDFIKIFKTINIGKD